MLDPALVKIINEDLQKRSQTVADKKTIIEYLVKEGVTAEEITEIMQTRCKAKKTPGSATGSSFDRQMKADVFLLSISIRSSREEIQ